MSDKVENKDPVEKQTYAANNAPTLKFGKLRFKDGVYETTDPDEIAMFDHAIATRPSVSALIRKVDREAALAVVAKFEARKRKAGVTGPLSSADLKEMEGRGVNPEIGKLQEDAQKEEIIPKDVLQATEVGKVERVDTGLKMDKPEAAADAKSTAKILGKK